MSSPRPKVPMFFCERAFGCFFILWGLLLIIDACIPTSYHGLFYGKMESYMPASWWGSLLLALGIGRWLAFLSHSRTWRLHLSLITFILLVIIASIAFLSGLYAATAPLTTFVAYIAFWCHKSLLRDVHLGL